MLSVAEKAAFERLGFVRLSCVFARADAASMRDSIWHDLAARYGVQQGNPSTWTVQRPSGFQRLSRAGAFEPLAAPVLSDALDDLLGRGAWMRLPHGVVPLVSFPQRAAQWNLPCGQWHIDFPARRPLRPLPGIRVLAFLDAVVPGGGGTVVIAGSHRLVERLITSGAAGDGRSVKVRAGLLRSNPWFRDLWSTGIDRADRLRRFMTEGTVVDGISVRAVELTGATGEVVLMHPWQLHAAAPNCGTSPRMMLSDWITRSESPESQ